MVYTGFPAELAAGTSEPGGLKESEDSDENTGFRKTFEESREGFQ